MADPEEPKGSLGEAMQKAAPYLSLGWNFALTMGVGTAIGYWLDRRLKTSPYLLLAGMALGLLAAFVGFFRVVLPPKGKDGKE